MPPTIGHRHGDHVNVGSAGDYTADIFPTSARPISRRSPRSPAGVPTFRSPQVGKDRQEGCTCNEVNPAKGGQRTCDIACS